MDTIPILFNQSLESLRRIGARGGKACARNRRARQAAEQVSAASVPVIVIPVETTVEAIARLDEQFPWLRTPKRHAGSRM